MKFLVTGPMRSAALAAALIASASPSALLAQQPEAARPQRRKRRARAAAADRPLRIRRRRGERRHRLHLRPGQRMRLLIATSGVQPTEENLPQFQREALVSLVDEHLQFQELRRVEKEQKIEILADDSESTKRSTTWPRATT
jgi:peptidyl-prolyl cis-trans isomerase SurA